MFKKKEKAPMPVVVEMPSKKDLDSMYASLLDDLALPEAKREAMIAEDDTKKWKLIQAHKSMIKTGKNIKTDEPMYWVGCLEAVDTHGTPTITPEKAQELETVLRTGHKKFLTEFVSGEGVQSLLKLTQWYTARYPLEERERVTLQRLMECYKWLMNNQIGMDGMLGIEGSISTLALAMGLGSYNTKPNLASAKEAVLLLAVTCFYSTKGRNMVVAAMDDMRRRWREALRYESLVRVFREAKGNNEFRAACMMFITTIVNSAASVDARVRVRNDFLALDIMAVMSQVVQEANENDEHCQTIATQFQVFEDMMVADHAEVIHELASRQSIDGGSIMLNPMESAESTIDLSDINSVFRYLKKTTDNVGIPEMLLEMLQALVLIPTERSLAVPVWAGIVQFANEATANAVLGKKRAQQKMGKLNYGVLHSILDERLKLDKNLAALSSTDDVLSRQKKKIEDLSKQLSEPSEKESNQVRQLDDEVKLLREQNAKQNNEISRLKSLLFEEQKKTAAALEAAAKASAGMAANAVPSASTASAAPPSAASSVGASPAAAPAAAAAAAGGGGVPADVDPKYVKYYRMKKAGLPEGAILNAMARDNVPVPPNFFDETSAGSAPSLPIAPNGGGGTAAAAAALAANLPRPPPAASGAGGAAAAAAAAAAKPKGPQKPVIRPRTKMRGFFWTKVQAENLEGTIWPEMRDDKVKLDIDTLEKKYQVVENNVKPGAGGGGGGSTKEKIHIVDGKRQQNVGIGVSKLRISNSDLIQAIIKLDETILSLDRTRVLVDLAPTDDEISMLRGYDGDLEQLTTEDRFLYELTNVPRLATRLKCMVTRYTFEKEALDIKYKLIAIREACVEIEKSKSLKTLLEIVLAIGNYLNGSTPRGSAWGFKLDSLEKLEAMKENDGKKSLIHYILHLLETSYPGVLETFNLPHAEHAVNISISETHNDMRNLAQQVRAIRNELQAEHVDKHDRFNQVFNSFQLKAEKQMQELEVEFQIVLEDFQKLGERYAESGPKVEPSVLFGAFVKFEKALKHAHEQQMAALAAEEKLRRLEEEKKKRATLVKKKTEDDGSKSAGVVDAFQKANQGDADTIVLGFRQRHRAASLAGNHD